MNYDFVVFNERYGADNNNNNNKHVIFFVILKYDESSLSLYIVVLQHMSLFQVSDLSDRFYGSYECILFLKNWFSLKIYSEMKQLL